MADIGSGEGAGILAKIGGAGIGGALWGIFASGFLVIPIMLGSLFGPLFRKVTKTVEEKVNEPSTPRKNASQKTNKTEREYNAKLQALERDRRLAELKEEMARLQKSQQAKRGSSKGVHNSI
jgi:hypothetical protein